MVGGGTDRAPRGAALEIAASDVLLSTASATSPGKDKDETAQLRAELRRWVQHCLQMDTALNAAEMRAAELDRRLRSRRSGESDADTSSAEQDHHRRAHNRHQRHDSDHDSDHDSTPASAEDTPPPPDNSWVPAPMSQEVHKALVEQSLLPAGRSPGVDGTSRRKGCEGRGGHGARFGRTEGSGRTDPGPDHAPT